MPVLVHKYGGTSVGAVDRIEAVADRILASRGEGNHLVVVVSAMGETTDHLMDLARQITPEPNQREFDMLLTAGERISMALLAMALAARGAHAISFTGSQSGIVTDEHHGRARITEIRPYRVREALNRGAIVIVAGFQGVSREREVTTLGRGGSDTTAVALAATFRSGCVIFTDVPGVFTADPRSCPEARRIASIDYVTLSTLAHLGARVMHARSVDLAAKYGVPLEIRSSFIEEEGTMVVPVASLEGPAVRAVARLASVTRVRIAGEDLAPGAAGSMLDLLSRLDVPVGLLALENEGDRLRLEWALSEEEAASFAESWNGSARPAGRWRLAVEPGYALVSLVGHELSGDADVVLAASRELSRREIEIAAARVGPHAVSFLVAREQGEAAERALHEAMVERGSVTSGR